MSKQKRLTALLLLTAALFSGCAASVQGGEKSSATLPPAQVSFTAPDGDLTDEKTVTAQLYLPDLNGTRLIAVTEKISLAPFRWYGEALLNALFSWSGEGAQPLPGSGQLTLSATNPIEISCGVATVNLSAQALSLSHDQLYTVFQSITDTLCQFGDITAVNLLVSGVQPGIDVASQTPAGTLKENHTDDLGTLWARADAQRAQGNGVKRLTQDVTLYFPAHAGKGILCETRTLAFSSSSLPQMAKTLLDALSEGPQTLSGLPECPALNSLLSADPAVNEFSGERVLTLRFTEELNERLLENGITRSCMAASLVYTMTTYLPGIAGVELYIGSEKLFSLTPEGTYQGSGETILFDGGVMRRSHFSVFLLSRITLYFAATDGGLEKVRRAVPAYETRSVRYLLGQLMAGPQYDDDGAAGLTATLPSGVTDGDVIGVSLQGTTAVVNLSEHFKTACQGMDADAEGLMVYSMVNTLTELSGINEICFFVNFTQPDSFAGTLSLPGTFLRNPDILAR